MSARANPAANATAGAGPLGNGLEGRGGINHNGTPYAADPFFTQAPSASGATASGWPDAAKPVLDWFSSFSAGFVTKPTAGAAPLGPQQTYNGNGCSGAQYGKGAVNGASGGPAVNGFGVPENATADRAADPASPTANNFERVEWFQAMLNALWPSLRSCIEQDILRRVIEPILAGAVRGLHFGDTHLGDVPPQLHGVRCVAKGPEKAAPTEIHLIFDVGFHPGGFNISLALGPLRAAVSGLAVRGRLCVCLVGLVSRMPVVRGIKVYFTNVPSLSFAFSGLAKALPVPPEKLKEFILEAIAAKLVLPHAVNINLDGLMEKFQEPNFLEFHELNSLPPCGQLSMSVFTLEGPLLENMKNEKVYLRFRAGCLQQTTEPAFPAVVSDSARRGQDFRFVLESMVDQDLCVEVYRQDRDNVFLVCDELVCQARVPVCEVARELTLHHRARLALAPSSRQAPLAWVTLAGEFRALQPVAPLNWARAEALLMVTIDAVVGLGQQYDGRTFTVRAYLPGGPVSPPVSTAPKQAGLGRVAEARALHATMEELRCAEAKERIRLLHQRGAQLTPEEVSWLLPGVVLPSEAERLMKEVQREALEDPSVQVRRSIELLVEEQLRLEVFDPQRQGLKVELWDEALGEMAGVVEWSSLSFLATSCPGLQDELHDYPLEPPVGSAGFRFRVGPNNGGKGGSGGAPSGGKDGRISSQACPRIHLKRSLLVFDQPGQTDVGLHRMRSGSTDVFTPLSPSQQYR